MKALLFVLLLSGCATGVVMSDEEKAACKKHGCSAWTEFELRQLIGKAFSDGYRRGAAEAGKGI